MRHRGMVILVASRVVARVKYKDGFLKISFNRYDNICLFNAFGFLSRN